MNIEMTSIIEKNKPNIQQPRRGNLYVGFRCHQKCGFCYYKHNCNDEMFSFEYIKKQIDFLYRYGIRDFEITGGEPSEYDKLRDVCEYIKEKTPISKISIITNGGLYKSDVWDLINEIVVSYHLSHYTKEYDKDMFPLGDTFSKVVRTVHKARQNGVMIRTNTVLGTFNLQHIDDIVEDLITFNPQIVNFLPVNLFEQSKEMSKYINYDLLREKIKTVIDKLKIKLPNSMIFVRYMPFCDMEGYQDHIVGNLQHIYDWFDWNRELCGTEYLSKMTDDYLNELGTYGSTSIHSVCENRKNSYEKNKECFKCKYFMICDGMEKTDTHEISRFIKPVKGTPIKNIMEYIGNKTEVFYKKWYNIS